MARNNEKQNTEHRLRFMIRDLSTITDKELDEFASLIPIGAYMDDTFNYEYSGNFIITKDLVERDEAVTSMCCGVVTKDVALSNGETLYFAFDYGH